MNVWIVTVSFLLCLAGALEVSPIRATGWLRGGPAVYLSKDKLEVIEGEDGIVVLKDVVGIPVAPTRHELLMASMMGDKSASKSDKLNFCTKLVNIDDGFFDNLPFTSWGGENKALARRAFFALMTGCEGVSHEGDRILPRSVWNVNGCLGASLEYCLAQVLHADIGCLVVEDMHTGSDSIELGGTIVLRRRSTRGDGRDKLQHASITSIPPVPVVDGVVWDQDQGGAGSSADDACLIRCHMEELVALSHALNMNVIFCGTAFRALARDAVLSKTESTGELSIECEISKLTCAHGAGARMNTGADDNETEPDDMLKVWEIYDSERFIVMSAPSKRSLLRASGVTRLPRPSRGERPLNKLLMELMDEAVRGEIISMCLPNWQPHLANDRGDEYQVASGGLVPMRQRLLGEMGRALDNGDVALAERLREEFVSLTRLRADPTQTEGAYDRYLDQDEWYALQRKGAMGL